MKIFRFIFFGIISIIALVFVSLFIWYQLLEKRDKAEFWFSLRKPFVQGSIEKQWFLGQAIKVDSSFAEAYMQKSISYNKRGDFSTGMKLLGKAVEIDPVNYLGYRGYVKLYMLHDYQGALNDYLRLDSLTPNFRDAPWGEDIYLVTGLCYWKLSNYPLAISFYDKVLEQDPDWIDNQVYLYRGMVHIDTKQYDLAIDDLLNGIQANPMAEYYYLLAYANYQIGKIHKSREYLNKGIDRFKAGYFRSNPYYEVPGQVYLSDFYELAALYAEN